MPAELLLPTARASDTSNTPYSGARWTFFVSGTSDPLPVYADADLTVSLGTSVEADGAGKFPPIYLDNESSYRGVLKDATGAVTIHDIDVLNPSAAGGLSDLADRLRAGDRTISVGAGGDYTTLEDFCDWLKTVVVFGTMTVNVTGSHTLDAQDARYIGPGKVVLQGASFGVGQGAYAITDLPSYNVAVADEVAFATRREAIKAYLRTQFNASIVLEGNNDLAGHSGIIGAFHFKRMLVEGNGRYTVDNSFIGSHANSESGSGALVFEDCAVVGGVWGGIGSGCFIKLNGTRNLFACQISGGPLDCIDGRIVANPSTAVDFYFPLVTTPFANMPQVGVNLDRASFQCGVGKLTMWGPFKHGFYMNGQCTVIAPDVVTTHVTQLMTAKDNSFADLGAFVGNSANPAETSATAGAEQTNITGNSTSKVFIFSGRGSVVNCDGGTINDSDGLFAFVMADGGTVQTFNEITAVNSRVNAAGGFGEFSAVNGGLLIGKFGLTTPVAGGNEWFFVDRGGRIILEANDGTLGFNIPRNSVKNSAAIYDLANPNADGGVYVGGTRMLTAQQAAIPDLDVSATSGTLPTANGAVVIANAASPTGPELLEYCRELEAKVEAILAADRAHKLVAS